MPTNVGEVKAKITGDASSFNTAAGSVVGSLSSIKGAFKGALLAGTAFASYKFFETAIKQASEFESKMTDVATLLDGRVSNKIDGLRQGILDLSEELPTSADELGAAAYDVVSAGISGTSNQMKVLRESAKLATAGLGTTKEAVDLLTTAINSYNLKASEAGRVANVFFQTVKQGKNTISDLSDFFGQVGPLANQVGVSFEELNAMTAVMTKRTGDARKSQRGLRQIMNAMLRPGKELKNIYEDLGVDSLPELVDKAGGLTGAIKAVNEEVDGSISKFSEATGSSRALSSALFFVGENEKEVQKITNQMNRDVGQLEKAVTRQGDSMDSEFQILKNRVHNMAVEMGEDLLPTAKSFVDWLDQTGLPVLRDMGSVINKSAQGLQLLDEGLQSATGFGKTRFQKQADRMTELRNEYEFLVRMIEADKDFKLADATEKEKKEIKQLARQRRKAVKDIFAGLQKSKEEIMRGGAVSAPRVERAKREMNNIVDDFESTTSSIVEEGSKKQQETAQSGAKHALNAHKRMRNSATNTGKHMRNEAEKTEEEYEEIFDDVDLSGLTKKLENQFNVGFGQAEKIKEIAKRRALAAASGLSAASPLTINDILSEEFVRGQLPERLIEMVNTDEIVKKLSTRLEMSRSQVKKIIGGEEGIKELISEEGVASEIVTGDVDRAITEIERRFDKIHGKIKKKMKGVGKAFAKAALNPLSGGGDDVKTDLGKMDEETFNEIASGPVKGLDKESPFAFPEAQRKAQEGGIEKVLEKGVERGAEKGVENGMEDSENLSRRQRFLKNLSREERADQREKRRFAQAFGARNPFGAAVEGAGNAPAPTPGDLKPGQGFATIGTAGDKRAGTLKSSTQTNTERLKETLKRTKRLVDKQNEALQNHKDKISNLERQIDRLNKR